MKRKKKNKLKQKLKNNINQEIILDNDIEYQEWLNKRKEEDIKYIENCFCEK